jgi:predicted nucleic acid-binding protein
MKGIADTGFLVAFGNRRDLHFRWAHAIAKQIQEPLVTCEAVLAEAAHLLGDTALVLRFIEKGLVRVDFEIGEHQEQLQSLARRYSDRRPDLADLCLIRMSELNPKLPVLTIDTDFLIYRRNGKESIPLVMPPSN